MIVFTERSRVADVEKVLSLTGAPASASGRGRIDLAGALGLTGTMLAYQPPP